MNAAVGIGSYIVLFIWAIFVIFCGLMTAFIVPNYMQLVGWDWTYMFITTLLVAWGAGSSPLVIYRK